MRPNCLRWNIFRWKNKIYWAWLNQLYMIWIIRSTTNCLDSFKTRLFMLLILFLLSYGSNGEHQLAWFSVIIIRFQADMLLNHLKENHFVDTTVTSLNNRLLSGLYSNRTHDGRSAKPFPSFPLKFHHFRCHAHNIPLILISLFVWLRFKLKLYIFFSLLPNQNYNTERKIWLDIVWNIAWLKNASKRVI